MSNNNLLVISSYPEKGLTHGKKVVGVASYTKNTLTSLSKHCKENITVFAEKLSSEKNSYKEGNIKVVRNWERNNLTSLLKMFHKAKKHKSEKILLEFEFAMFGGISTIIALPLMLLYLKASNKQIYFVLHHVVSSVNELAEHIGIQKHSLQTKVFQICTKVFYSAVTRLSAKVIVFEDQLANNLKKTTGANNIIVIPHAVETFDNITTKEKARKMLNIPQKQKVALLFGFLAHYKGTDIAIKNVKKSGYHLLIAGGANKNHLQKKHYQLFLKKVNTLQDKDVTITGFVDEKDIPLYFKAADVAIFPYRTFMSSSGPISIAAATKTPFAVSEKLSPFFTGKDIKESITKQGLNPNDLILNGNYKQTFEKIAKIKNKIKTFEKTVQKKRSWKNISKMYHEALTN